MKKILAISCVILLASGLSFIPIPAQPAIAATTIYVDVGNTTPPWDGTEANPYQIIQDGINAASPGDTVQVAAGTYYESIILKGDIVVRGAGADDTTINGSTARSGMPAYHVVVGADNATIDGFTITGGNANGSPTWEWCGGGMFNLNVSPIVTNCIFTNNSAKHIGGGMVNYDTTPLDEPGIHIKPIVTNCIFINNTAITGGGGMFNNNLSPIVSNCIFISNSATDEILVNAGGGMYNHNKSSPTLVNCIFYQNSAEWGGALYNRNASSPIVTNCTFTNNIATLGGGILNYGFTHGASSPIVTNCILWNNGEEIYNHDSAPVVTYSDVEGGYPGVGNIDNDPVFVNPIGGDYHLNKDSPCIDKGNNEAFELPESDYEGDPRVFDGNGDEDAIVDIGADEYVISVITATIDINPNTLNLKSKGRWVMAFIELPEGHDVNEINIATILLNEAVPVEQHPLKIQDRNGNGIPELMVKFDRASVQSILDVGDEVEITITGELMDTTTFKGVDFIRVIDRGKGK